MSNTNTPREELKHKIYLVLRKSIKSTVKAGMINDWIDEYHESALQELRDGNDKKAEALDYHVKNREELTRQIVDLLEQNQSLQAKVERLEKERKYIKSAVDSIYPNSSEHSIKEALDAVSEILTQNTETDDSK